MPMPNRQYSLSSSKYRFGFNTQEKDDEVYGEGNLMSAQYWEYDTRIGRRWNIDPIVKDWESPYATNYNNPIWNFDEDGLTGTKTSKEGEQMTGELKEVSVKAKRLTPEEKAQRKKEREAAESNSTKPDFNTANTYTSKFEGGWVNDPVDPGGATNRGIIFSNFKRWAKPDLGIDGSLDNLKKLSADQAETLYQNHFWNPQNFDQFNNGSVAFAIYDFSVNSGRGIKKVEKAFLYFHNDITVDGKLTKDEIAVLNTINSKELFDMVQETRLSYMQSQIDRSVKNYLKKHPNATQKELTRNTKLKFKKGWFKRVNSINYQN